MTSVNYEDVVAAATVGLSHRPLRVTGLSGAAGQHVGVLDAGDQAAALLDAAVLLITARRAGVLPAVGVACPAPAAADPAPELPARAAGLLERARGSDPALLADLLETAASLGYRAPAPLLPTLLDAAVKDLALRPAVAAVLGARGRWLAGHRSDWQRVAGAAPPDLPSPGAAAPADPGDPGVWETGDRPQRRAHLAALRDRDPASARNLLAAGWSRETGDDRTDLLAVLARGLSAADEEFLEAALDDRKPAVRATAGRLLAWLPGSAFTRRAAERAAPLLRVEPQRLVATPPEGADPAAIRDGISARPPSATVGAGAWLLTQIIAAAPLAGWVTRFGLDAGQIVSLPVAGSLGVDVRAGWRLAAIRQGSREWAEALLTVGEPGATNARPPVAWPEDRQLAAVLPPGARTARVAALLAGPAPAAAVAEAAGCPGPWPDFLASAVMAALSVAAGHLPDAAARQLLDAAGRNLPVTGRNDYAAALLRLADTGNCPPCWSSALRRAEDAVALRRAFVEEIR